MSRRPTPGSGCRGPQRLSGRRARLIAAARAAARRADAIHPGYGFLSENPEFAAAVLDAGLTWIRAAGRTRSRAMGSKIEAKKMMAAAGVPVLDELDPDTVTEAQLPVLVKASAGGGGRGMRVVRELSALPAEVEAARREAQSAFGDPTVFCERYLPTGHHVEVQVARRRATARCGPSANGNAPFSGATRRSSRKHPSGLVDAAPACGPSSSTRPRLAATDRLRRRRAPRRVHGGLERVGGRLLLLPRR